MASWKDYAPSIGTGVGAIGMGALLAAIGDKKKRIRNGLIGAILGGAFGNVLGTGIQSNDEIWKKLIESRERNKSISRDMEHVNDVKDKFDRAVRRIGIKGDTPEERAEAFDIVSGEEIPQVYKDVMDDRGAILASQAIGIPEDAAKFKMYHAFAKRLGQDGWGSFLPIRRDMMREGFKPGENTVQSGERLWGRYIGR